MMMAVRKRGWGTAPRNYGSIHLNIIFSYASYLNGQHDKHYYFITFYDDALRTGNLRLFESQMAAICICLMDLYNYIQS